MSISFCKKFYPSVASQIGHQGGSQKICGKRNLEYPEMVRERHSVWDGKGIPKIAFVPRFTQGSPLAEFWRETAGLNARRLFPEGVGDQLG
jgi:hypothetical protein